VIVVGVGLVAAGVFGRGTANTARHAPDGNYS
jgi:hypothetical protein